MNIFDPIALCLVRELVEADDALNAINTMIKQSPKKVNWKETYEDCWQREENRDEAIDAVLSHLLIIPCPSIDTSAYEALWRNNLKLPNDDRENGKLWDDGETIAQQAMTLYRKHY